MCFFALAACNRSTAPQSSIYEVKGNETERIAAISAIIEKHRALPTALKSAHFIEEQIGNGILGPSDFREFYILNVTPRDVQQWTPILIPLSATPEYASPIKAPDWWITNKAFASLQFYKPDTLTGRSNGWIGIEPQTGHIFIFSFTM